MGFMPRASLQTISMANAVEDAKRLDQRRPKLGQSAGVSGTLLRNNRRDREEDADVLSPGGLSRNLGPGHL